MLTLAFETSAKAGSVALTEGGKLLGESYQNTGLTHSQTLMVMAEDLLKQCGKTMADVTAVAVAEGPGSFTGVRIGVAAAKGLAWGGQLPCYGVSTLEAMAVSLGAYEATSVPAWMPGAVRSTMPCSGWKAEIFPVFPKTGPLPSRN